MRAVILCYYGAVQSIDDLPQFYTSVFGNRKPSETYLKKARKKYLKIHRADPLYTVSLRQKAALERRLSLLTDDTKVYVVYKHTKPKMAEVIEKCLQDGATTIDLLPMSPFFTNGGGAYYYNQANRILKRFDKASIRLRLLSGWYVNKTYEKAFKRRLQDAINWLPQSVQNDPTVIFTSHSQPGEREHNKKFLKQYESFCQKVANDLKINDFEICYRSAGDHPQIWLTPYLTDVLQEKISKDTKAIVISDVLSPVENIEVLEDVVNDASKLLENTSIPFVTTEFLNDADDFITALTQWILKPHISFLKND